MSLLLHIDSAQQAASACLSKDGSLLKLSVHDNQVEHAAWLHVAIKELFKETGHDLNQLKAVSVSIGPGSYTGLRIGLATAKGICYALGIPLIAIGTLEMMAYSVRDEAQDWICPVIDARRMEIFTALYDKELRVMENPSAMLLDENSFNNFLSNHNLIFCGSGIIKLQKLITHPNATFSSTVATAADLIEIAHKRFSSGQFDDVAYTEPLYIKDFYHSRNSASTNSS